MKCQMDLLTWYCRGLGASGQQRFGIPAAPPADGWGPLTPRLRYYMSFDYLSTSFDHLSTSLIVCLISVGTHTLLITLLQRLSICNNLFVGANHRPSSWLLRSNIACSLACVCIQSVCPTASTSHPSLSQYIC